MIELDELILEQNEPLDEEIEILIDIEEHLLELELDWH